MTALDTQVRVRIEQCVALGWDETRIAIATQGPDDWAEAVNRVRKVRADMDEIAAENDPDD